MLSRTCPEALAGNANESYGEPALTLEVFRESLHATTSDKNAHTAAGGQFVWVIRL